MTPKIRLQNLLPGMSEKRQYKLKFSWPKASGNALPLHIGGVDPVVASLYGNTPLAY